MKSLKTKLLVLIFLVSTIFVASPVFASEEEGGSVYDYAITDITQTAPDTIVVTARCRFCPYCNPNDPGWRDRGDGCIPFACGYPPPSFPSYAWCRRGSPDGRYAAIRLTGGFGSVVQKLVCDQSNWPLNTLWSHNFVFSGLTLQPGEPITIEADFYCSYCRHWYATPKTFVPQMYTFVFIPFHWDGPLMAKPSVVSRTEWGCPDGQNSPRWPPEYYPVTHVIIHHTATTNVAIDWAKEVYKRWEYHANTKGWGDIGYNYLIDSNGVIYEGRAGGDDVIAGHAYGHNKGTMGIAFLGTFSTVEPTSAALRSAQALIAWKCAQRNIDPLESGTDFAGTYYNYIAGHRDVSVTECPGDKLYNLLPIIRQSVFNIITNPLGSNTPGFETGFFAEVKKQMKLIVDDVGVLTDANTRAVYVEENLLFPPYTYWEWWQWPPGWRTIEFSETDFGQAADYMNRYGWSYMATFASNHGATGDRYIAITNEEMWGSVEGFSNWGPTVISEISTISEDFVVLHELGHSWGLLDEYQYHRRGDIPGWYEEARAMYRYDDYGTWIRTGHPPNSYPGDDTPGVDWSNGRLFDSKRCIMGPADPWPGGRRFCPAHQWDDPHRNEQGAPRAYEGCFAHVDELVSRDIGISSAGLVSIIVTFYKNQSIQPTVQEITGVPLIGKPLQYLGPGNYSIQVFSEEGNVIYNSNITLSFMISLSQYSPGLDLNLPVDMVTVHWLAPMFSETTATVELKDNVANQIIASQIVTIAPTAEAWIDYKTTDGTTYNFGDLIEVTTEVNTTATNIDITLDVTLLDPNNIAQDYRSWTGTIYPTPDPVTLYLTVPSSGIAGTWRVYVVILNSTGQFQDSEMNLITVGIPADTTPPTTILTIGLPQYTDSGDNLYVTSGTSFNLLATDDPGGSGVASTGYRIRNTTYDSGWLAYSTSFYLTGLIDGNYFVDYNSTDNAGNVEATNTKIVILDNTPPSLTIETPSPVFPPDALQDGVWFKASAWDLSAVASVTFSIQCAQGNVISPEFESMPATLSPEGKWQLYFGTTQLPDGFYLFVANGTDVLGNTGTTTVPFSIRNWACIELLPASEDNKAGRTMPVKFSLRVVVAVDPAQPFVWNEELTIVISENGNILQTSTYGATSRDYRIDPVDKLYITNFRTLKRPTTYVVEIYRKGMLIGSFTFETVK